jgi:hypothetical protein
MSDEWVEQSRPARLSNVFQPRFMLVRIFLVVVLIAVIGSLAIPAGAQERTLVVADFNTEQNRTNLGNAFGTWDKDSNDKTQGCLMSFVNDDAAGQRTGMSVRLEYDVDSPNPAYNGFWVKLGSAEVSNYNILSLYIKGDAKAGFARKIKVEVKYRNGDPETYFAENVTDQWQKFSFPIKLNKPVKKALSEFTIVFDDINSRPKVGAVLIDDIRLEHSDSN